MLLWAEDVDVPLDTARQAVQHVHDEHMAKVTQHGTASHVALAEPLQSLMIIHSQKLLTATQSLSTQTKSHPQHPS